VVWDHFRRLLTPYIPIHRLRLVRNSHPSLRKQDASSVRRATAESDNMGILFMSKSLYRCLLGCRRSHCHLQLRRHKSRREIITNPSPMTGHYKTVVTLRNWSVLSETPPNGSHQSSPRDHLFITI